MDPALKEYLDKLHQDAKADSAHVLKQLQAQSSQIDDLLHWKPDLEARFAKLESTVAALRATAPPSGAVIPQHLPSLLPARGDLHGPDGRGDVDHTGGGSSVTRESLAAPPGTGMPPFPFVPTLVPPLSSSILANLGQPPSMSFLEFNSENPQLWKHFANNTFRCSRSMTPTAYPRPS